MTKNNCLTSETGPVRSAPFPPWPFFEQDEIAAAMSPLSSGKVNYWTGQEGREFEREFATFLGCNHAIALTNGTVALELALYALGIGAGDEVITTCRTFIASASCIVARGATPILADVDSDSQNITAETILPLITPRTKAIIVVHLAGWPCEMDPILALAKIHNLRVIEDCAQCHGAIYKGKNVGTLGDVAAFSFCQDKIMTTGGEGGLLTTNDETIWRRAWEYKDHGKSYDAVYHRPSPQGFRWLHESFGTNWRMTEMQAAIGRVQLRKLNEWVKKRQHNASILATSFSKIPGLRVPATPKSIGHAYYKFYTFINPALIQEGWDRDRIQSAIISEGIPCFNGSCSEIYLEKAFEGMRPTSRHKVARILGETSLMFLVHPTLSDSDMLDTCNAVIKVMSLAARK
jgi:hypothetical protein